MRTGNIRIIMFLHSLEDTIYFPGAEAQSGGGVLTQGTDFCDAVIMLVYTVLYFANAFYIFRKSKRAEIPDVWEGIWNTKKPNTESSAPAL
jgi:uncharacterized protein